MKLPIRHHNRSKVKNIIFDQTNALIDSVDSMDKQEYQRNKSTDSIMKNAELINFELHKSSNTSIPTSSELNFKEQINVEKSEPVDEKFEVESEEDPEIDLLKERIKKLENYIKTKAKTHGYNGLSNNYNTMYNSIKNRLDIEEKLKLQLKLKEYEEMLNKYKSLQPKILEPVLEPVPVPEPVPVSEPSPLLEPQPFIQSPFTQLQPLPQLQPFPQPFFPSRSRKSKLDPNDYHSMSDYFMNPSECTDCESKEPKISSGSILKKIESEDEYSQLLKLLHPRNKTSFRPTMNKIIMKIMNSKEFNPMNDKFIQMYIKNSRDSTKSSGFFGNMFRKIKTFFNKPIVRRQMPIAKAIIDTPQIQQVIKQPLQKINDFNNTIQENVGRYRPTFDKTFQLTNELIRQYRPDLSDKLDSYKAKADSIYDYTAPKVNNILSKITTGGSVDSEVNKQIKKLSSQFDITNDIFVDPYGGYFDTEYNKILKKVTGKYYIQTFRKYNINKLKYSGILRKPFKKSEPGYYSLNDPKFSSSKSAGIFKSAGILKSRGIESEDVDLDEIIDDILDNDLQDIKKILIDTNNEDLIEIIIRMVEMIKQAKEALNSGKIDEDEYNTIDEYGYKKFEDDDNIDNPITKLKSSGIINLTKSSGFFQNLWNGIKKVGKFIATPFRWVNDKIIKPVFNSSIGKALRPLAELNPLTSKIVGGIEQGSKIVDTVGNIVGNGFVQQNPTKF